MALAQLAAAIIAARGIHLAIDGRINATWVLPSIAGLAVCALLLEAVQRRLSEGLGQAYVNEVRDELFSHLLSVDSEILQRRRHGAMLQAFVGDLTALRQWVSEGIMRGAIALLGLAGLLAWMATQSPFVTLVLAGLILTAIVTGALVLRPLDRAVREVRRARGRVAGFASERLAAIGTVQTSGRIASEKRRLRNRAENMTSAVLSRAWLTGLLHGIPALAVTLMMLVAAGLAGDRSSGSLAGQFVLIGLLGVVLRDLARAGQLMIPGRVSKERVEAMFSLPRMTFERRRLKGRQADGNLVLDRIELASGARSISVSANKGQVILIDGDARIRRALFRVLTGRAQPHSGKVLFGGYCLSELSIASRRKLVGCYSPELPLLRASTSYNIRHRAPHASLDETRSLATRLGFDSDAREQSAVRVKLARALLGTPPILVLELTDPELSSDDYGILAGEISRHSGIVLLASDHVLLRKLSTRRWTMGPDGLVETEQRDESSLSLIATRQKREAV